jgi:hypothetical protein
VEAELQQVPEEVEAELQQVPEEVEAELRRRLRPPAAGTLLLNLVRPRLMPGLEAERQQPERVAAEMHKRLSFLPIAVFKSS